MSLPLVALKDCCTVVGGATPKREVEAYWDNQDIPWVTPKDISKIKSIYFDDAPEYISQKGFDSCAAHKLPKGSLLLTSRAPIGNVAITTRELCTNQGFKSLVPNENVDIKYLYFCMLYSANRLDNEGNGATFKEVSKKVVEAFKIPLPPLDTQKQIAAVLEKADQLRKDCQQMEQELNSLAQSVFIDMFGDPVTNPKGWELESLGALCDFENGDRSSNYPSKGDITETGKLFLSSADIGMGDFQIKSSKFISQEKFDSLSRGKCQTGDVLMTLRGNGLGRCCVFDCEYDEGFINAQMVIIRPDAKKCSSRFLVEQLNCKPIFNQLLRLTSGSAQPQFSAADVKGFQVLIPPLSEQKKYHKVVDRIKRDVLRLRTQHYDYENLFSSLMQKAFKGELNL